MSTEPRWDKALHPVNTLRLCAMLSPVTEAEFATLRDALDVSDSVLSKLLKALRQAGYVTVSKPPAAGRRRTWVALTSPGREALRGHLAELRRLADLAETTPR